MDATLKKQPLRMTNEDPMQTSPHITDNTLDLTLTNPTCNLISFIKTKSLNMIFHWRGTDDINLKERETTMDSYTT